MKKILIATWLGLTAYNAFLCFKVKEFRDQANKAYDDSIKLNELSQKILFESRRSLTLNKITPELEDLVDDLTDFSEGKLAS